MSRNPKEALDAGSRHLRDALTYSQSNRSQELNGETLRTTVTMRPELHGALRILAATKACRLNDIMLVAMEDLLVRQGVLPGDVSRPSLRERLQATERGKPSELADTFLPSDPTSE
ncbi:hypothetical protein ABIA00_001647 [Bradyrhizobium ottawaense]|uniref:hypothetical protein n=1 Tax=Bradyrhizobium TaxID=374 RepID=UPI002162DA2B|nr:hypothetical protein [Bradyrhizobium arachidis]UVO32312.1 hypothetical protein KUF59_17615 [Bradyrhizobium arachidis]